MKCKMCGAQIPDGLNYCPECGAQVTAEDQQMNNQNYQSMNNLYLNEQRKQYFKSVYCDAPRRMVLAAAIMMFISGGFTSIIAIALGLTYFIDVIILVTLGVLLLTLKSRVASVITLLYSIFNVVVMWVTAHTFGGWLIIIAGILATVGTFSLHSKWKAYLNSNTSAMPQSNIS